MWSVTLQLMKKSLRMLIPAGIAIVIGTAFIASTFLFGNAMNNSLSSQLLASFGQANYTVAANSNASPEDQRGRAAADFHLDAMRAIDGVDGVRADARANIEASKAGKHISAVAIGGANDAKLLPVTVSQGRQPKTSNEIVLPSGTAQQLGAGVGDAVEISGQASTIPDGPDGPGASLSGETARHMQVVGLSDDPNGAFAYYGGAAIVNDADLAALQGLPSFDTVQVPGLYLDVNPAQADAALARIRPLLPQNFTVQSRQAASETALKQMNGGGMSPVTVFLMIFGVIAMLVAALVIANTFQVLVAQRRRTFALLRTIGAKRGQIYRSVILEAMLLGLVSSLIGIGAGIGIMALAVRSDALGKALTGASTHASLVITAPVIAVPLAFGVLMTVLASLGSARASTKVTPLEALRPMELSEAASTGHRLRTAFGALIAFAGVALAAFSVVRMHGYISAGEPTQGSGANGYSIILLIAIAGCVAVFLGLALTAASWLPKLMKGAGTLVSWAGPSAKIANANVQKNPRRVAATGLALLIGVTLVSTIATGAASSKETMNNALNTRYSVDLVATGYGLNQRSASKISAVRGISHTLYAPVATGIVEESGHKYSTLLVGVADAGKLQSVMHANLGGVQIAGKRALFPKYSALSGKAMDLKDTATFRAGDGGGAAHVGSETGSGKNAGKALSLSVDQSDFRQVSDNYDAVVFVDDTLFASDTLTTQSHILLASVDPHATNLVDTVQKAQAALGSDSGVSLTGPIAKRISWEGIVNTMMTLLIGLLAVAVLIALIGVANTLSLSVIERTRESATLRAIGMTRSQLRRSLSVEALLIALVSGLAGIALGTLFGWLGSYIVFSLYGDIALPFDWKTNGIVLLVAAVAALLASVFPARRALKTAPVEALAEA
ncbi:MAG: FtsX-like permease family protein [Bifidobacterium tibiigranuli]|nr:FtsX-like permease family protein [Bifidobacterium tibiigranuli]